MTRTSDRGRGWVSPCDVNNTIFASAEHQAWSPVLEFSALLHGGCILNIMAVSLHSSGSKTPWPESIS
ncbi:hypothetical protein SAY87_008382 [Trapa incisa]|uniref:Uncharacterized protein n=1 Tax=Trapa incisa TaxID=236973 RepID=A0AAN7KH34_9MYRT|nr:hypothetical protein SAY87_008382 [Trapa incisa]